MLAFAVAQSTEAPLRPENQANLIIDRHIFRLRPNKSHALAIRVPAGEVKNAVDLDFELSGEVLQLFDEYCKRVHPLLCDGRSSFLYPGAGLGPKAPGSLSPQIARFIE